MMILSSTTRTARVVLMLALGLAMTAGAQPPESDSRETAEEIGMPHTAKGSFDVQLTPQAPDEGAEDSAVGRMRIDKTFQGDLDGTSKGQMLAFRSAVQGSAGYVAVEEVSGTLGGRQGTFVLQHSGSMDRGEPSLSVTVVPDSGTGELAGLTGSMSIDIQDGDHFYVFEYSLPASASDSVE